MKEKEILENNKLIAEFLGYKTEDGYYYMVPGNLPQFKGSDHREWAMRKEVDISNMDEFKECGGYYWKLNPHELIYNKSWEWLMTAIDKIENMDNGLYNFIINNHGPVIEMKKMIDKIFWGVQIIHKSPLIGNDNSKLELCWIGVLKFIEWHNKKNK